MSNISRLIQQTMSLHYSIILCLLLISNCFYGQSELIFKPERQTDIVVSMRGQELAFPWVGGFNNVQPSAVDLNNDGIQDLFVFDRSSDVVMTFINGGAIGEIDYTYAPEYEANFPSLKDWALLVDYNCDGLADLFTSFENGIRVYTANYKESNEITFSLDQEQLFYDDGGTPQLIKVAATDIPAITDIDDDGDIDLLTFTPTTGGFVEYFQNQAVEMGSMCGSIQLLQATSCWGNIYESGLAAGECPPLVLDTTCSEGKRNNDDLLELSKTIHPGSTVLAIDLDGDADKEILLGDISCTNVVMGINGGDLTNSLITDQQVSFPENNRAIDVTNFPATFYLDVNNDNRKDLVVAPNAVVQSEHFKAVWWYENTGNPANPFQFRSDDLWVNQMFDVSRQSYPVFFDHNGDGLLDLVVGNYGYRQVPDRPDVFVSSLALLENVGTATAPAFEFITRNYAGIDENIWSIPDKRLGLKPAFGDLDGDGDQDMVIGDEEGFLHYFTNDPTEEGVAQFSLREQFMRPELGATNLPPIDPQQFSMPTLADVNKDGLLDLLIGTKRGTIAYWENTGTATQYRFEEKHQAWGAIEVSLNGVPNGYAIPQVITLNGMDMVVVGSESGLLRWYAINPDDLLGAFTEVTTDAQQLGQLTFSSPAIADIDGDGLLDIVSGNYRGGLVWFEQTEVVGIIPSIPTQHLIQLLPNPAQDRVNIVLPPQLFTPHAFRIRVYDVMGRLMIQQDKEVTLSVGDWETGVYFVEVELEGKIMVEKLVVR